MWILDWLYDFQGVVDKAVCGVWLLLPVKGIVGGQPKHCYLAFTRCVVVCELSYFTKCLLRALLKTEMVSVVL